MLIQVSREVRDNPKLGPYFNNFLGLVKLNDAFPYPISESQVICNKIFLYDSNIILTMFPLIPLQAEILNRER